MRVETSMDGPARRGAVMLTNGSLFACACSYHELYMKAKVRLELLLFATLVRSC